MTVKTPRLNTPFRTTTLGYPRLGPDREYKKLLEAFWKNPQDEMKFLVEMHLLESGQLHTQAKLGVDLVPVGDFSFYDHVLDTAIALNCVPQRFGGQHALLGYKDYFAMARGAEGAPALEMTKWFNTNYHYLVPELPQQFTLRYNMLAQRSQRGENILGTGVKPVILGPFTFLRLAKLRGEALAKRLPELVPLYREMLSSVNNAELVQVDEPALVTDVEDIEWQAFKECYEELAKSGARICIQTYYGDVAPLWKGLCELPVAALGIDFVADLGKNLQAMWSNGFPQDKILVAGIVDGRNIWRTDLNDTFQMVKELSEVVSPERIMLAPSCSLLHLPETVRVESHLPKELHGNLCFAQERLEELALIAKAARYGKDIVAGEWQQKEVLRQSFRAWEGRYLRRVQDRTAQLSDKDFSRVERDKRADLQRKRLALPYLPTTTIGSFPQTAELRAARAKKGSDPDQYRVTVYSEVEKVIRLQEEIGLDVLVDGEPDRTDMVEFFAEKLRGCATLKKGWVQSYGSRCVRPPVIYGDVERDKPLTLEISSFAQSLTKKLVKGMLTGPITILCWSFVREDTPRRLVAYQLGLAIRDEVKALEQDVKLAIIQIDEPAFREGLPLRKEKQEYYLDWAAKAFRLAASGVEPATQIHTHMCYAEFRDILPAIAALDADVISIEDARSHGEMIEILKGGSYPGEVGPGVWDIHSPEVPSTEQIVRKLEETLSYLPKDAVWVNPDCGLKTRGYKEVIESLKNMVEAARRVRAKL